MGREIRLFKSEERKSLADAGTFMRHLADKVSQGRVVLRQGQEEITLQLPGDVVLEVQVEEEDKGHRGTEHSLEVQLKWYDSPGGDGSLELG